MLRPASMPFVGANVCANFVGANVCVNTIMIFKKVKRTRKNLKCEDTTEEIKTAMPYR